MKKLENAEVGDGRKTFPGLKKRPIELKISGWANFGAGITNPRSINFSSFFCGKLQTYRPTAAFVTAEK